MKGMRYLVDEEGRKTHAVLELDLWQDALDKLLETPAERPERRKPGGLNELLSGMGYTQAQLDEMNAASAEEGLRPLTVQELGLTDTS